MKKVIKCMAGILALTLAFAQVAPVSAFAEETTAATEEAQAVYSGDCSAEGSSVTWTYNQTEKTLTFSGTGAIKDYQASGEALPWLSASDTYNVKKVILEEGITSLPDFAEENGLFDLEGDDMPCTIILPESLTDFHYGTALSLKRNIIFYVKDGSAAYCDVHAIADQKYPTNRSWRIYSSGMAENPAVPAEGTSDTGLTWKFDYETRQLTLTGTDDYQNSYLMQHLMPLMKAADKVVFDENFTVPEDPNETVMPATYTYLKKVFVDNPALQYFNGRSQGIYCYYRSPFQTACVEVKEAYEKQYLAQDEINPFEYSYFVVTNPNLPTYSGSCGDDGVIWTYDVATATMTFSGTGEIQDFRTTEVDGNVSPSWMDGFDAVPNYQPKHIVIEEGITGIGIYSRWNLFGEHVPSNESERCTVTIPESLKNCNLFDYAINPNDYLTFRVKQQSVAYFQLMNAMDSHPDNHWIYESTGLATDVVASEDGMTEGSSSKGLKWKFDGEKRILYLSGTDVPARKGSALRDIQDLVNVARTIVIDKDFVPPLGTDLTVWTDYYLKVFNERGKIYHNVYLYRGSQFDKHYLAAKALYKEDEHLTDEEEERYGIFNQGYYYIGESDTCGDVNLDGTVDILDAIYFGKYQAGLIQLSDAQLEATDCNGNGVTGEEADLGILMKFLIGGVTDLPYTEE